MLEPGYYAPGLMYHVHTYNTYIQEARFKVDKYYMDCLCNIEIVFTSVC